MEQFNYKKYIPYLAVLLIFILIIVIYFSPALEGKKLKQGDIDRFKAMSKEIVDFRKVTGEQTLWTNNMFSGMPAYFTSVQFDGNLFRKVNKVLQLGLPHPANQIFLYFLGFFILMLVLRVRPWVAAIGAMAFAFSSYFFIIIEAGHNSKAAAVSYMAPVLAGIILAYRGKYVAGALLTAFFLALEISANHLQITYYLFIIVLIYGIFELVETISNKNWNHFLKATGVLFISALLAVGTNATSLLISSDHTQYTTRGKSELTDNEQNKTSGLDRDYITAWSYGVSETMTLLVPDFMGGASYGKVGENSKMYELLVNSRVPRNDAKKIVQQLPLYWGTQPFTSGPVYVGAIIFFLFILGLFVIKGKLKWWLLTVTILSIMLAWGKNFMWFSDLFLDYLPGYNKFRAVSMTLVIAELAIPLLGMLALAKIFAKKRDDQLLLKGLKYSLIILGGILLILIAIPGVLFDFNGMKDTQYLINVGFPQEMHSVAIDALIGDRIRILRIDAFRSLIFILLSAGILWLYMKKKLKIAYAITGIALLVLIDMWAVDKRYLNDDNFVRSSVVENPFKPSEADKEIMRDRETGFRVLNLTVDPFRDASTSFFHHSIGGYHGAKLKRYQELINFQIEPEMNRLFDPRKIENVLKTLPVLNMLNTKYFIIMSNAGPASIMNPYTLGPAWFVKDYEYVQNADEEIIAVGDINPAVTAIIDERFSDELGEIIFQTDTLASIALTDYKPNHLTYTFNAATDQLAVFSEVYYPAGWNAYIDGQLKPHFRVNWILRAMIIPAGNHAVEFKFEPTIYRTGEKISLASSVLLLLLIVVYAVIEIRKNI
jgi:hypothetical protein